MPMGGVLGKGDHVYILCFLLYRESRTIHAASREAFCERGVSPPLVGLPRHLRQCRYSRSGAG